MVCTAARQLKQKHALPCDSLKIATHKLKCTCSIATFHSTAAASKLGTDAAAKQGTSLLLQHPWRWKGNAKLEIWDRGGVGGWEVVLEVLLKFRTHLSLLQQKLVRATSKYLSLFSPFLN